MAQAGAATLAPKAGADLLARIQNASRKLDYAGVFAYQQGGSMQSSRVTHVFDGKRDRERLEILDGQPVEFLRDNDEIQCLLPDRKTILSETRQSRDRFPGLLMSTPAALVEHYDISTAAKPERVADRDCQVVTLTPKDASRYGYRLCTDTASHLLLREQTLSPAGEVIEQVAFIALQVGAVDPKQLQPRWNTEGWKQVRTQLEPVDLAKAGWQVGEVAGFHRMMEVQRSVGSKNDVKQVMLSDGLSAISIFIEPYTDKLPRQIGAGGAGGAVHVIGRRLGDYWITVLGEVPLATIQQVSDSIRYVQP